jgi:protein tyrosine phosphatase domain-containing protein 1
MMNRSNGLDDDTSSTANITIESLTPAGIAQHRVDFPPEPHYNKLSENLRTLTPPEVQCSMFCGGRRCKYENGKTWKAIDTAIESIYSHW